MAAVTGSMAGDLNLDAVIPQDADHVGEYISMINQKLEAGYEMSLLPACNMSIPSVPLRESNPLSKI
jgi:hypothetical protein